MKSKRVGSLVLVSMLGVGLFAVKNRVVKNRASPATALISVDQHRLSPGSVQVPAVSVSANSFPQGISGEEGAAPLEGILASDAPPERYRGAVPKTQDAQPRTIESLPESVRNPKPSLFRGKFVGPLPSPSQSGEGVSIPAGARDHFLSEKIKDKAYREAVLGPDSTADTGEGAYLLPDQGLVPRLFSVLLNLISPDALAKSLLFPQIYVLDTIQTDVKDQFDRRTCQTFAAIAAIESTYLRDFSLRLNLSEQFLAHIGKSVFLSNPRFGNHENQTSYWGGGNTGASISAAAAYSVPIEQEVSYWPLVKYLNENGRPEIKEKTYLNGWDMGWVRDSILGERGKLLDDWTSTDQAVIDDFEWDERYIPHFARQNAKYRVKDYAYVDKANDPATLEKLIKKRFPVAIDLEYKVKFNPVTQNHDFDDTQASSQHAVLVIGFVKSGTDDDRNYFIIKNSYGGGPQEYVRLSYNMIRHAVSGGTIVESVVDPNVGTPAVTNWLGYWNLNNDGWRGRLLVRRMSDEVDPGYKDGVPFLLGSFFPADGSAVKTLTAVGANQGRTITFYQSGDINVKSKTREGQSFTLYQEDSWSAAGVTT